MNTLQSLKKPCVRLEQVGTLSEQQLRWRFIALFGWQWHSCVHNFNPKQDEYHEAQTALLSCCALAVLGAVFLDAACHRAAFT